MTYNMDLNIYSSIDNILAFFVKIPIAIIILGLIDNIDETTYIGKEILLASIFAIFIVRYTRYFLWEYVTNIFTNRGTILVFVYITIIVISPIVAYKLLSSGTLALNTSCLISIFLLYYMINFNLIDEDLEVRVESGISYW